MRTPPSRFSAAKTLLILAAAGALPLLGALLHYRAHLLWRLGGDQSVLAIPTRTMPDTPPPEDWVECRFGPFDFTLPPELAEGARVRGDAGGAGLDATDGSRSFVVLVPTEPQDPAEVLASLRDDLHVPPQGQGLSVTRLRLASYQADSDDFRWSMTPQEVRWHTWCIGARFILAITRPSRAEYLLRDDLEGILDFNSDGSSVSFDWETADGRYGASLAFQGDGGGTDPAWMRSVCQSMRFSEDRLPQRPLPADEDGLQTLFEICPSGQTEGQDESSTDPR
jgi:hypothetical protein